MSLDVLFSAYPLVMLVGWLAWMLRGEGPLAASARPPRPAFPGAPDRAPAVVVPVTSDGVTFVPVGASLTVLPLARLAPEIDLDDACTAGVVGLAPARVPQPPPRLLGYGSRSGGVIEPRSLTAARIRGLRHGPWLLEVLGRDADYDFVPFESLAGARAALEMLDRHAILLGPRDARGERVPSSPEDFEEARRRLADSIRWMALDTWAGGPRDKRQARSAV